MAERTEGKMKKLLIIVLLLSITGLISCNDDEEDANPEAITVTKEQVTGKWEITSFKDDGEEIVDQFNAPKQIEIFLNGDIFFPNTNISGRWSLQNEGKELIIIIDLGDQPYKEFEDDWAVIKVDENNLWLMDNDALIEEGDDDNNSSDSDDDDSEEVRLRKVAES